MTKTLPRQASDAIPGMVAYGHPEVRLEEAQALDAQALACQETARDWAERLQEQDRRDMVVAFYEAESLAAIALDHAIEQVGDQFRDALVTQRADEARHIDVFSRWGGEVRPLPNPRRKRRDDHVWFTLLLINELTGYCQFMMLHSLLQEPGERRAVQEICRDEQEHIARLIGWLRPIMETRSGRLCETIVSRFRRGLDGRMRQFFPREELGQLRDAMQAHVDGLLEALFPGSNVD